jgi:hypothetical protein
MVLVGQIILEGEQRWVTARLDEMQVLNCVGMFAVLRRDVLFINPQHNDSIILSPSDGSRWSNHFRKRAALGDSTEQQCVPVWQITFQGCTLKQLS